MLDEETYYDLPAIRQLLLDAFTPEELRRFCQDRPLFRRIVYQLGPKHGLADIVDETITYCEKWLLFEDLLDEVWLYNPAQYDRCGPYYYWYQADAQTYCEWGDTRAEEEDWAGAIADYTRAIELDPELPDAYFGRALARSHIEDLIGPIVDFTYAIELDPNYAEAYFWRGVLRAGVEDWDGADADIDRARELGYQG